MSGTLLALAIVGLGSVFAADLHSQTPSRLRLGQTIRIMDETGHRHTGEIHAMWDDSLTLKDGDRFQTYTFADLSMIEQKTGSYTSRRTLLITMDVMGLAGALVGAIAGSSCGNEIGCPGPVVGCAFGLLGGVAVGLPLGLILTPIIRYSRWEPVPMPSSRPRLGLGLTVKIPLPAW